MKLILVNEYEWNRLRENLRKFRANPACITQAVRLIEHVVDAAEMVVMTAQVPKAAEEALKPNDGKTTVALDSETWLILVRSLLKQSQRLSQKATAGKAIQARQDMTSALGKLFPQLHSVMHYPAEVCPYCKGPHDLKACPKVMENTARQDH